MCGRLNEVQPEAAATGEERPPKCPTGGENGALATSSWSTMMTPEPRLHPRISVNKLGEYLISPPLRRHEILERQKYPLSCVASYYEPARRLITDFILGGLTRRSLLAVTQAWTSGEQDSSEFARRRAAGCTEAVLRCLTLLPALDFRGLRAVAPAEHDHLRFEGVDVSVLPDVLLRGVDGRGRTTFGAIKLHFPKTHALNTTSAEYVATLLHVYLRQTIRDLGRVEPSACWVVDVFSGGMVTAPRAYRRRLRDIGAACEEIRLAWPEV